MDLNKHFNLDFTPKIFDSKSPDVSVFCKLAESWGGFSNFAAYPLETSKPDLTIRTSEALYQMLRYPDNPEIQQIILNEKSPMAAKMKSKKYYSFTQPNWDDLRIDAMIFAVWQKYLQHPEFRQLLASAGPLIVEKSRKDDFWGAKVVEGTDFLKGTNLLGQILSAFQQGKGKSLTVNTFSRLKHTQILGFGLSELF